MELIDADLYKRRLMEFIPNNDVAFDILADMPRVDIVRCKDCRHHSATAGVCNLYLHFSVGVTANDYCSFGERRTV